MNVGKIARSTTETYLKPQTRPMITKEKITTKDGRETEVITLHQGGQQMILKDNIFKQMFNYFFTGYDYRELARRRFNELMKKGELSHHTLIHLTSKLYGFLGSKAKKYKSYTFENNAHEIYVLLKDYNLKPRHFKKILKYLNSLYL